MGKNRTTIPIGIVFSTTGPYALLGREARDGALMALAELNERSEKVAFEARIGEPGGQADRYPLVAEELLKREGCRHIVGGITSWSRKELIPVIERLGGLLWYPCPYEGYECNENVVYLGACPNQHIVPLFDHVLPRFGTDGFLVGSNYIWGWETNRIARELILHAGGSVAGERYVPLGSVDVSRIVSEIAEKRPSFVLNTLIGPSSYAFLEAYGALAARDADFHPDLRPVVSCNLTEAELALVGSAAEGHLATAVYFDSLPGEANARFKDRLAARFGSGRPASAFLVGAYNAVSILGACLAEAGGDDPAAILAAATGRLFDTPAGPVAIDPRSNHATHRPLLGRATAGGVFDIFDVAPATVVPDPYLVGTGPAGAPAKAGARPVLRVIQ